MRWRGWTSDVRHEDGERKKYMRLMLALFLGGGRSDGSRTRRRVRAKKVSVSEEKKNAELFFQRVKPQVLEGG